MPIYGSIPTQTPEVERKWLALKQEQFTIGYSFDLKPYIISKNDRNVNFIADSMGDHKGFQDGLCDA